MDTLTAHVMAHPLPAVRADIPSRSTGLNCFTCHFDGKDFISLKSFDAPEHAKDPKQSLSLVAKNNMTCYPCHFDVLDSFNPGIAITRTGSMVCVNCHVETDQQNKKTHYFYWKGNVDKVNPLITNILNDFRFGWAGDKKAIDIHWENKSMPHTLPIATELLFNIEVLSKDSVVLSKKTIRLNRKKQYDKDNYEDYGNNYLGGIVGDDMPLFASRNYTIPFDSKTAASLIRISYVDKSQFWLHDSIGHTLSSRVLNLAE
jgi:hypothetical protein